MSCLVAELRKYRLKPAKSTVARRLYRRHVNVDLFTDADGNRCVSTAISGICDFVRRCVSAL